MGGAKYRTKFFVLFCAEGRKRAGEANFQSCHGFLFLYRFFGIESYTLRKFRHIQEKKLRNKAPSGACGRGAIKPSCTLYTIFSGTYRARVMI